MNKKPLFMSAGIMLIAGMAFAQRPFTIQGNIEGNPDGYIYLDYTAGAGRVADSAMIRGGKFSFSGKLDGATSAYVAMDKYAARNKVKYLNVYLSPGNMRLAINYDNFDQGVLTGSAAQEELNELNRMKAPVMARMKPLSDAYQTANEVYIAAMKEGKDEATLKSLKEAANTAKDAMDPLRDELNQVNKKFMDKYPASVATANILRFYVSQASWKEGLARYEKLSDDVKKSSLGKEILKEIEGLKKGSPGAMATNFTSTELRGGKLSLSDYKGKYVLVDFWASWCVPCRKGNPHLLALYAKYKDKGFEIIGISDDDSKPEKWKEAVEQDKIGVWKHVLRGLKRSADGGFDRSTDISENYGIHSLPTKILIAPDGKIVGRYGGGGENDEAMDKKLAEVFTK